MIASVFDGFESAMANEFRAMLNLSPSDEFPVDMSLDSGNKMIRIPGPGQSNLDRLGPIVSTDVVGEGSSLRAAFENACNKYLLAIKRLPPSQRIVRARTHTVH